MDHYKALGLQRNATKAEIKEAFRRLAMKHHPDKHSQSSKAVRDDATLRFKQLSEAYGVLIDDRKRADYNISSGHRNRYAGGGDGATSSYSEGYYNRSYREGERFRNYAYGGAGKEAGGFAAKFGAVMRFMTTRMFLLNVAFAGTLLGATYAIDGSREILWKMQNSGKSFEEAMESIEKAKARRDGA